MKIFPSQKVPSISGIYKISFPPNKRYYIGAASNIKRRIWDHRKKLRRNKHYNKKLQSLYNKYGEINLKIKIIEKCDIENLINKEQFWLEAKKPKLNILQKSGYSTKHAKNKPNDSTIEQTICGN